MAEKTLGDTMTDRLTKIRGDKPPAQYMEALAGWRAESASADFHELRQDFNPPKKGIQ